MKKNKMKISLIIIIALLSSCNNYRKDDSTVENKKFENTVESSSEETLNLDVTVDLENETLNNLKPPTANDKDIEAENDKLIINNVQDEHSIVKNESSKISEKSTNSVETSAETSSDRSEVTIELDKDVITNPSSQPKDAELVLKSESKIVIIPFKTITLNDNSLELGSTRVETQGSNGFKTEIYEITY